jgi:uncharacterized protein YjbI with pentapeptide repeats
MSIIINNRPSLGGGVIFESQAATTIKEAINEMRSTLASGDSLGLQGADLRGAYLQGAYLQGAYLQDANLQGADLRGAYLQGAYLQDANLQGAYLQGANLQDAYLQDANLQGAYLRGAGVGGGEADSSLTPKLLGLPDADPVFVLSVIEAALASPGALEMETWHTCETTHCLAGWAVHLSGAAGKALEATTSPSVAGAILAPSLAHLFYVSNEEALEALPGIKAQLEVQMASYANQEFSS